ncbi:MAG TPA: endolytic transglycosylase MltG [Bacteroidales bacterium]|jgi:UPF0755 protein|nr:endolytic transglycosylase MltG [Bacteroidales bacterium]MDD4236196.1 endolytic transglycosylase MltG [Bacteroidales bacterium]MDY0160677.1 endolytic transglycosylase MltG [Bacteroidales bacterium]HXK80657.1 endolytic transglycosylase MltG [Bacteroidales bacterium]
MASRKKIWITLSIVFVMILAIGASVAYKYYKYIYAPAVHLNHWSVYFYVPTGSTYETVTEALINDTIISDLEAFDWVAQRKNYPNLVKPGRYLIHDGLSNSELIDLLRSGEQTPVDITFISVRTLEQLAGRVGDQIEADSLELIQCFRDKKLIQHYGFNEKTFIAMFIPNTYQFYWNTSAEKFIERMAEEFKSFWTQDRLQKANDLGFKQSEVITLASIVEQETQKDDEKARVAGVYINRLNKGIKLQADPTVIYAIGDFSIRRVLYSHLEYDSPYNTYKYVGLPPGPICIPSITSIDAVLNYEEHSYLYFCAREDFSGYHNFARTLAQHNANARKYQQALRLNGY